MATRKETTIKKLWKGLKLIDEARLSVNKLNEKGKQFDFVSDPRLADVTDRINSAAKALNGIVYQE